MSAALDGTLMMELAFIAIFPSIKLTEFLSNGMPKSAASRSSRTYRAAGHYVAHPARFKNIVQKLSNFISVYDFWMYHKILSISGHS